MRIFACPVCGGRVYFNDMFCTCGAELIYDPDARDYVQGANPCGNRQKVSCNWAASDAGLCASCSMTKVVPDHFSDENLALWSEAEDAKRWVLDNLGGWGWFVASDPGPRPRFHLVSEVTRHGQEPVVMGHADGLVTINVTEADPVEQVRRRTLLDEPYRTMHGHFRHELAHFLFLRLSENPEFRAESEALMGDFTADYGAALNSYYDQGPPEGWETQYISAYATAHPHEDWAETTAHLLHLTDILDSAMAVGLGGPFVRDAYASQDADALISDAVDFSIALNHVNRAMGLPDLYPFVLTPPVLEKLRFVHRWLCEATTSTST